MTRTPLATKEKELQIALENRAFEIQLFWQRSNYFMALMTALGIGVFTINETLYACIIAFFAAITSWYWYKTNLGSKFWHESWEVEVVILANELNIRSFIRPTAEIKEQVKKSLDSAYKQGDRTNLRLWIDKQILTKPSVSHYMIMLSLTSTLMWSIIGTSLGTSSIKEFAKTYCPRDQTDSKSKISKANRDIEQLLYPAPDVDAQFPC